MDTFTAPNVILEYLCKPPTLARQGHDKHIRFASRISETFSVEASLYSETKGTNLKSDDAKSTETTRSNVDISDVLESDRQDNAAFANDRCVLQKLQAYANLRSPLQYLPFGSNEGHAHVDFDANGVETIYKT